jgi:hypothetical protein
MDIPYISGTSPPPKLPLDRFLPPIPAGMASAWAKANLNKGDLILEPFGFNPLVPIELVKAGYPVLVAANNPIHAFLIRMLASAPQKEELVAALQDLAIEPKGDERMEPYIRSFYRVNCTDCGTQIEADAFLWKKGDDRPFAALVSCPNCGASGEQELDPSDPNSLEDLPPVRLHQARALNRITGKDDPLREQVMNALNTYPVRPLIVLQTIINKLDSLEQTPRRKDLLIALILYAADQGNTLWAYPSPRERPRQIVIPSVYQEKNLWKAMEDAIDAWQVFSEPVPVIGWNGEKPDQPALILFEGRLKELDPMPLSGTFPGIIPVIPRPNQAFWTLSALWTGWIWGHTAVEPIRSVLTRQRYDWNWHTNALRGIFQILHNLSSSNCKIFGLIAEMEPMLLLATLLAVDIVGCQLSTFAQSIDDALAQCQVAVQTEMVNTIQPAEMLDIARQKVFEYLQEKGESAHFEQIHAAAVTNLAHKNALAVDIFLENENLFTSETEHLLETLFEERGLLERVGGGIASHETGIWWLINPENPQPPLIDRLEQVIVRYLVQEGSVEAEQVKLAAYEALPGIFTPSHEDLINCLESYAELTKPGSHRWTLRESDRPDARKADIVSMRQSLTTIGQALEYAVEGEDPLFWYEPGVNDPIYSFHILASAIVEKHIRCDQSSAQTKILVIPGSRANLLAYKEERDPVLKTVLDRDYVIVKFRLVRDLEANPLLSRELFKEQIMVDPPEYRSSQLALF